MSFNPNIPTVNDPTLQSFFQLRANFQEINRAFSANHAALNQDPNLAGNHTVLSMTPQSDPVTDSTQIALYNKIVSSIPQLFFRPNSSQTPIQLTYQSIKTDSSSSQYSFIAGPFIVYGGFLANITDGQMVTLTPGTTLLYVDLTGANSTINKAIVPSPIPTLITGMTFTIRNEAFSSGKLDAYYFAIGM